MSSAHHSPGLSVDSTAAHRRHVREAAEYLREQVARRPSLAIVVGTGRETMPENLTVDAEWPLDDIPHFPDRDDVDRSLVMGTLAETTVMVLVGPLALHEGYTAREVAFPVRMLGEAGIDTIVFTNSAVGVAPEVERGNLFLVSDHINFQGVNPLVGPNVEEWGPRFPDMSEPYDPTLRRHAETVALDHSIRLHHGVFLATLGPTRGTRAEYRMARTLGADAVGTGTVPEVIAARHMDLRVVTLSILVDRLAPDAVEPIAPGAVTEGVETAREHLRRLLGGIVPAVSEDRVA